MRGLVSRRYLLLRKLRYGMLSEGISDGMVVLDGMRDVVGAESVRGQRTWEGMSSIDI